MEFRLSSKQKGDVLSWRGATDFSALFRERLLESLKGTGSLQALRMFEQVQTALAEIECANETALAKFRCLEESLSSATEIHQLRGITAQFYAGMYEHLSLFRSSTTYYEQSSRFIRAISDTLLHLSRERLGLLERHLPEHVLIALGPTGRSEFSPFCPLQMALVCRHENAIEMESLRQYGALLHEGFETCGLRVDQDISPRNDAWCGSLDSWRQKLSTDLEHAEYNEMIDLLRLSDQTILAGSQSLFTEFSLYAKAQLSACHNAQENLVSRASLLSNGLGLLGGLRLEKNGPYRGCFPLLDHALQPLTATISAFSLLYRLDAETSPERLRELMVRGELDEEITEQLLHAWNDMNELRLIHERACQHNWLDPSPLHIDLDTISDDEQESLRNKLEAVGHFQRYLHTAFTAMGR